MKNFTHPIVFGLIGSSAQSSKLGKRFNAKFKSAKKQAVLLHFKVGKEHLKNIVKCMELMDVAGLIITGAHSKDIIRHLDGLNKSVGTNKGVNLIYRAAKRYFGLCSTDPIADCLILASAHKRRK